LLSFFSASFYQQLNLNKLPNELKRDNTTVVTKDDYSYLNPPETFLRTGIWKQEGNSIQSHFLRPPGYGVLYYLFLKLTNQPLFYLKLFQLLFFACSVYWFFSITHSLTKNKKISLITSSIYGLTPFATNFLSYTLTESITPSLTLLFIHLLFEAHKKECWQQKNIFYFLAALSFSVLLIVRPPLGFIGTLLPLFIFKDYWQHGILKTLTKLIIFGTIAFSFMSVWQIRNYQLTHSYVGLHAIYYPDNNSIYRPTFKEYWNFVGGWAQEGAEAHSYMVPMWKAAIKGDTSEIYVKNALTTFPEKVINHYGKERLTTVFKKYQTATLFQKRYYDKNLPMPNYTPDIELEVIDDFTQLTKEYKTTFWLDYHILSPLKVFKVMSFHSNLSLYIFQHTYRGNWLMETARTLFYGLHSLCFLGLILSISFIRKSDWRASAISGTVLTYVFYLCYFQRGIEERYTLPILSLLMIGVVYNGLLLLKSLNKNSKIKEKS
jgi:hypothetical protein